MPDARITKITNDGITTFETPYTEALRVQSKQQYQSRFATFCLTMPASTEMSFFPAVLCQIVLDYYGSGFYENKDVFEAPEALPSAMQQEMIALYWKVKSDPKMDEDARKSSLSALQCLKHLIVLNDGRSLLEKVKWIAQEHPTVFPKQNFIESLWKSNQTDLS